MVLEPPTPKVEPSLREIKISSFLRKIKILNKRKLGSTLGAGGLKLG